MQNYKSVKITRNMGKVEIVDHDLEENKVNEEAKEEEEEKEEDEEQKVQPSEKGHTNTEGNSVKNLTSGFPND